MKHLLIIFFAVSIYGCCGSQGATRIRYEWDTITVKKPVLLPISHDSIRIWDLDLGMADTVIRSGRAQIEIGSGKTPGKKNIKVDCLPDTVIKEIEVEVPIYLPKEMDCTPDKSALKAKRSQGRTEGAAFVIIGLLLIIILFRLFKGVVSTYIPR